MGKDVIRGKIEAAGLDACFDIPLKEKTTFRIGGFADIFIRAHSAGDVRAALKLAAAYDMPIHIMGNGSNMLVSDAGIRGITLQIGDKMQAVDIDGNTVRAQAGVLLSVLSRKALEAGLNGLCFASGIPGTLGGGVAMNAGAYGGEMSQIITGITALDRQGNTVSLGAGDLSFGYRRSAIIDRDLIVTDVSMELTPGNIGEMRETMEKNDAARKTKQPQGFPSAGSVFKRPEGHFAGALIESAGLKGFRIGDAEVSDLHAGFIINRGNATADDVMALIRHIQTVVLDKHGVHLEPEIHLRGFDIER